MKFTIFNNQYLNERKIFAIVNFDVRQINEICVNKFREFIHSKHVFNVFVNSVLKNDFDDECFHHYKEILLIFQTLRLNVNMFVIILRNLKFLIKRKKTRIRITRVENHVIEIEIIDDELKKIKIVLFRIHLQFKNDENNKNRRAIAFCQITKR